MNEIATLAYAHGLINLIPPPSKGEKPFIGKKMSASLLCHAIRDGVMEKPRDTDIILGLNGRFKKKIYNEYILFREKRGMQFSTHLDLSTFLTYTYPEHFSWFVRNAKGTPIWNLGDGVVFLTVTCQNPLFPKEEREIQAEFEGSPYKDYKIVLISNINGTYQTNVGGQDMINKCYHNYKLYKQFHLPIVGDKEALVKIWPNQQERLLSSVKEPKELFTETVKLYFVINDPNYHLTPEYYTENGLRQKFLSSCGRLTSRQFRDLRKNLQGGIFPALEERIVLVVACSENPTKLDDFFYRSFVSQPHRPNQEFVDRWAALYGDEQIGIQFSDKCENVHLFDRFPSLKGRVLDVGLRTREWIDLYSSQKYKTGRNTKRQEAPKEAGLDYLIRDRYNLIRGNFGEAIALSNLHHLSFFKENEDRVHFATPSMIVEDGEGSRAYCPDSVAIYQNELVPIEVKTIIGSPDNMRCFKREFDLARLQIWGAIRTINSKSSSIIASRGVGVFLFISTDGPSTFHLCHHVYNFHSSELTF